MATRANDIPVPMGEPISPDDEHDELCEALIDEYGRVH
jgi:hypothetical protein